jgi:hypothetical protein
VSALARANGAIGAGHVAGGGLQLLPTDDGVVLGSQRRAPGAERRAVGIDVTESIANCHLLLP